MTRRSVPRAFPVPPKHTEVEEREIDAASDVAREEAEFATGVLPEDLSYLEDPTAPADGDTRPSTYFIKELSAAKEWEAIRPRLLKCVIESYALPDSVECTCCSSVASIRCLKCGPRAFFCKHCFSSLHRKNNIFHTGEIWEVCKRVISSNALAIGFTALTSMMLDKCAKKGLPSAI